MKIVNHVAVIIAKLPRSIEWGLYLLIIWFSVGLLWFIAAPAVSLGSLSMPAQYSAGQQSHKALTAWFQVDAEGGEAAPVSDLKLIAVIAGEKGVALVGGLEASAVAIQVGDEFRTGSRLVAVQADRIVIEKNQQRQEVLLPQTAPVGVNIDGMEGQAITAAIPQPQEKPPVAAKLSRGQFTMVIQGSNLAGWDKGLVSDRDQGIRIEDASVQPIAKLLKLKNGDVMKSINGRPLKQLEDISLVYNEFTKRTAVELSVLRNGTPQTLIYQITP